MMDFNPELGDQPQGWGSYERAISTALKVLQRCKAFASPTGLFSSAVEQDQLSARIRQSQLEALMRLTPVSTAVNVLNSLLIAWALWNEVPRWQLVTWASCLVIFCLYRRKRSSQLKNHAREVGIKSRHPMRFAITILPLAGFWLVPPMIWFSDVGSTAQLMVAILTAGMMSGACLTLFSVPLLAIAYILLLTLGAVTMMISLHSAVLVVFSLVFAASLCSGVISNAHAFVDQVRASTELQEQAALIELLREFEASGSKWLWELDDKLRLTFMSRDMANEVGAPLESMMGVSVLQLLDPRESLATGSSGMTELFGHFRKTISFREIAIPMLNGTRWWSLSGKPVFDEEGRLTGWRGVGSDVTGLRLIGSNSVRAARRDPLTGLGNRLLVREQLEQALLFKQTSRVTCCLVLIDLDRFKLVNDTLGHAVGDRLLCEVAARLEAELPKGATAARLGGDEFAVVLMSDCSHGELASLAKTIVASLSACYVIEGSELRIGATVGIAIAPDDGDTQEQLIGNADLALYCAKKTERGSLRFFETSMAVEAQSSRQMESDLRHALQGGEFKIAYQEIVDARTHEVVGREALLRWNHSVRGEVSPADFVPVMEEAGLLGQIGNWVIREACMEAANWPDGAQIAVNVSVAQLAGAGLATVVMNALGASGLAPDRLELEVTESIFLGDDVMTKEALSRLSAIGVRLVLDDFGTGYSSFGYLARGGFSKIKIDRSFISDACRGDGRALAILEAMLALASRLDLEVTAEGIETGEQASVLHGLGCNQLQGFYFSRPEIARDRQPTLASPVAEDHHDRRRA